jgi:hypothetical protein
MEIRLTTGYRGREDRLRGMGTVLLGTIKMFNPLYPCRYKGWEIVPTEGDGYGASPAGHDGEYCLLYAQTLPELWGKIDDYQIGENLAKPRTFF